MSDWWLQEQGAAPVGPMAMAALVQGIRDGRISVRATVCHTSPGAQWSAIANVPQLAGEFAATTANAASLSAGLPPPTAPAHVDEPYPANWDPNKVERSFTAWIAIALTVMMAIVRLAAGVFLLATAGRAADTGVMFLVLVLFVSCAFYVWATYGLLKAQARAYRAVLRVHIILALFSLVGGVLALTSPFGLLIAVPQFAIVAVHAAGAMFTFAARDEFSTEFYS